MNAEGQDFFVTGGTLRYDAPCYVERQADRDLFDGLIKGDFCYVLTARQMGKSSLMIRTAARLREEGCVVVVLDLTAIGQNLSAEQWYYGLLVLMGQQLRMEDALDNFWRQHESLGPLQRWLTALEKAVLPSLATPASRNISTHPQNPSEAATFDGQCPLVVFLDEIDVVNSLPFSTDEFFASIRQCYNQRSDVPVLRQLTFCMLGVTTPANLIRDPRTTPFNIGRRIELHDFTFEEAAALKKGLALSGKSQPQSSSADDLLRKIFAWTNGHPYLTQRFCQVVARKLQEQGSVNVDRLCFELFLGRDAVQSDDNLYFVRERILNSEADRASLLHLYDEILRRRLVPDEESNPLVGILRLSGIVRSCQGQLIERNRIYSQVFDRAWVRANMPDAEIRRQRAAFRQGALRTAGIGLVVLSAMGFLALYAIWQARQARESSAQALLEQARAGRWSGRMGQRHGGLSALAKAATWRPTREMRDEAIACMTLPDLRPAKQWPLSQEGAPAYAVDAQFQQFARSENDGRVVVGDLEDGLERISLLGPRSSVSHLAFSEDGRLLLVEYQLKGDHQLSIFQLDHGTLIYQANQVQTKAWSLSSDGNRLALGLAHGKIELRLLDTKKSFQIDSPARPIKSLKLNADGSMLAVASDALSVTIMDWSSREIVKRFIHRGYVNDMAWHPSGTFLATACDDREIYIWNIDNEHAPQSMLSGSNGEPLQIAFSHRGDLLASVGTDAVLRLWHPWTGYQWLKVGEHQASGNLQFSPDDRWLGHTMAKQQATIWEVAGASEFRTLHAQHHSGIEAIHVDISGDGRLLASTGSGGVHLWGLPSGQKLGLLDVGASKAALFYPDSSYLLVSGLFGLHAFPIQVVTTSNLHHIKVGPVMPQMWPPPTGPITLDGAGNVMAAVHEDHVDVIPKELKEAKYRIFEDGPIDTAILSPNGRWIVTCADSLGKSSIWNAETGDAMLQLPLSQPARFAFSPDSAWLLSGTSSQYRLWRTDTWKEGLEIGRAGPAGQPVPMAFSADGQLLAISPTQHSIALVAMDEGTTLANLEAPDPKRITALCISPNQRFLVAATDAQTIQIWDLFLIHSQLNDMGLGWNQETPLVADSTQTIPVQFELEVGDLQIPTHEPENPRQSNAILDASPSNPSALHMRGHEYFDMGRFDNALADFDAALQLRPDSVELLVDISQTLNELARFDEALIQINRALDIDSENPALWMHRGEVHQRSGDFLRSIDDFSSAITIESDNWNSWYERGWSHAELSQWQEAMTDFKQAHRQNDSSTKVGWAYGLTLLALEDTNEARQLRTFMIQNLEKKRPDHLDVWYCLRLSALFDADPVVNSALLRAGQDMIESHPDDLDFVLAYALLLCRNKQYDSAVKTIEHARHTNPGRNASFTYWNTHLNAILAMAHGRLAQTAQFMRYWERIETQRQNLELPRPGKSSPSNWANRFEFFRFHREAAALRRNLTTAIEDDNSQGDPSVRTRNIQ